MLHRAILTGVLIFPVVFSAQSINQTKISGTVTDPSGAVVPSAKVTITDVGTNISQATVSNSHGSYAFTALRPSNYRLLVQSPAFGPVEKDGITLTVNQQTILNVTLKPASQQATVTVEAIPVLLDSADATLGTDIPSKYLTQIPLENRDPFGVTFLAAGVTETAGVGVRIRIPVAQNSYQMGKGTQRPIYGWMVC